MTGYLWTVSAGGTITAGGTATSNTMTVSWNTAGAQTVGVNYTNSNGCTAATATSYPVTVNALPVPTITGPSSVCATSTGNVYTSQAGMTGYVWTVSSGGTITAGGTGTSNTVTVSWNTAGTQSVGVNYTNGNGCTAATATTYNVTVNALPVPTIAGPPSVCLNSTGNVYTTQAGMTGYVWTVSSGGTITAGGTATSNTVTVTWNTAGAQTVGVNYTNSNGCTAATATTYIVTVNALPVPTIAGPTPVCATTTGNVYTTQAGMTNYVWTVSAGGTVTAGGTATSNTVTVTWNTAGAQTVGVNYTNANGCTAATAVTYNVTVNALPVPTITGPASVCVNSTGNVYTTQAGMSGYTWTVSPGGTVTAGSGTNAITVSWTTTGAKTVTVNYTNANSCTATTPTVYNVTVNPLPVPTITGPATICAGTAGNVYTSEAGMTNYVWTVSAGGTITAGGTTASNTVTVTWNTAAAQTVIVNYTNANGCTAASPAIYNVAVNPLPLPVISGPSTVCSNSTGNVYTAQTGMSNYVWTVSAGGTVTAGGTLSSNFVTVTWTTAGARTVSVNYANAFGCAAATPTVYNVTVSALPVPTLSGETINICPGSGWTPYTTQYGMSNYVWTVSSGGLIATGQGTAQAQVYWSTAGSQWVAVSYTNASGCTSPTPTQLNVTVSSMPSPAGTITGTATVCAGAQGVAYSVAAITNAASYDWFLPAGATLATGAGTNNITVNYGVNAVSGGISVRGNNACGNGIISPAFQVTINPVPSAAGVISGKAKVCIGTTGVLYSVGAIANATSYVWTIPSGAVITSGANTRTITVTFTNTARSGNFAVYGKNACGNGASSPPFAVTVSSPPPNPQITPSSLGSEIHVGDVLISSATEGNQWYLDDQPIAGATDQTLVIPSMGTYYVIASVGSCSSDKSNDIMVGSTGIETKDGASFVVYPVPNYGLFTASVTTSYQESFRIMIYNTLGVMVHRTEEFKVQGKHEEQIDVRELPSGIYSVVFTNEQRKVVRKIFINK